MTNLGAVTLTMGCGCVWPLVMFAIGWVVGRRRIRLRNPFTRGDDDF